MKHKNKITGFFLMLAFAMVSFGCQTQTKYSNVATTSAAPTAKAQSPTEAYKMLFTAVKAKDKATIKGLMSKGSLGLAEMSAGQQKKPLDQILENGLVAPTLSDKITEIRDERVKDNFGAIEVYNEREKRWEDLPFVLEDGGWKLAVGDLFADTYKSPGKSIGQIESESSNKGMPMPMNTTKFPDTNSNSVTKNSATDGTKSVEVPVEKKP